MDIRVDKRVAELMVAEFSEPFKDYIDMDSFLVGVTSLVKDGILDAAEVGYYQTYVYFILLESNILYSTSM